jgi:hypothetical protein
MNVCRSVDEHVRMEDKLKLVCTIPNKTDKSTYWRFIKYYGEVALLCNIVTKKSLPAVLIGYIMQYVVHIKVFDKIIKCTKINIGMFYNLRTFGYIRYVNRSMLNIEHKLHNLQLMMDIIINKINTSKKARAGLELLDYVNNSCKIYARSCVKIYTPRKEETELQELSNELTNMYNRENVTSFELAMCKLQNELRYLRLKQIRLIIKKEIKHKEIKHKEIKHKEIKHKEIKHKEIKQQNMTANDYHIKYKYSNQRRLNINTNCDKILSNSKRAIIPLSNRVHVHDKFSSLKNEYDDLSLSYATTKVRIYELDRLLEEVARESTQLQIKYNDCNKILMTKTRNKNIKIQNRINRKKKE